MSEPLTSNRLRFPKNEQKKFIERLEQKAHISELARVCKCSERAIRDWRREKFLIPEASARILSRKYRVALPTNVKVVPQYAHTKRAGKLGGQAIMAKYGRVPVSEERRKESWKKWWDVKGKYIKKFPNVPRSVHKPLYSKKLAEFIGIMMGDGGMTKYQATITLHRVDDREFAEYVVRLIQRLFKLSPSVHTRESVIIITISSVDLVVYLNSLGLPVGDKIRNGLTIPDWTNLRKDFSLACVRGLFDTDGSVYQHRYRSKGKMYSYTKMNLTSASPELLRSVGDILTAQGFRPSLLKRNLYLHNVSDVTRYFHSIGSNNPKHLRRYKNALK